MNATLPDDRLKNAHRIARIMDSRFRVPGTRIRFGFDSIIGLIPGAGDIITAWPTLYYLFLARKMELSSGTMFRMIFNLLVDMLFGSVPLLGDVFDVFFKSNQRNYRILEKATGRAGRVTVAGK